MKDAERQAKLAKFRKEVEDLDNVVGTAIDPKTGKIVALVTEKKPERDLPDNQLVANNTSLSKDEHGVVEVGELRAHSVPLAAESSAVVRPVEAGAEEQPKNRDWVGTASFLARVVDTSKGEWSTGVSTGSVVRLSNWHVYVGDEFVPHRPINQPFKGGKVGELVGEVPITDGVKVDVAARSVSIEDGWGTIGLETAENGEEYGRRVVYDITDEHGGKTVTKSGRTTDVTTAEVVLVDVSVDIDYGEPGHPNLVRVDDCVITTDLGAPGDSGSPVFLTEDGALCGLYFAGSAVSGVFSQIGNVRDALGVEPITDWDEDTPPTDYAVDRPTDDDLEQFKRDLVEFVESWHPS
ncbi:chymotrypsin family serine protease [Salinigranum halophilum]|jgi:hypothetical protein|uniref:hypothetical protein n=1 Tax=Salinigranum halophilum TaxID=2565931 RepID=UPI0010A8B8B2|nr:hypothetical protein [Salinigranum halophilum]